MKMEAMMTVKDVVGIFSLLTITALFGAGCDDSVHLVDSGRACLSQTGTWTEGGQSFEADEALTVIVRLHDCLSSSCDTNREAECSVELVGDRIVIHAEGSYTDERGLGRGCTDDCSVLEATCVTDPLPAGDYTVVYDEEEISFTLPSMTGNYCLPMRY